MGRYSISGAISTILDATFDATSKAAAVGTPGDPSVLMGGQALLGEDIPTGRVFWLRSVWAYDASAAVLLHLFDATVAVNATDSSRKLLLQCASGSLTMADIPAPGLKFKTGCVVCKDTTDASGCFTPGSVGGAGYYEGG